ncbi:hypothetical protein WDZ17_11805 [Pseudokineococcus basanitobsidens]|uniref:DUF4383 domain-containing protein n=1 Tax=Pseudokineococcus basanitobsidens TaxID=1926649 RepID=A0ABU8RLP1_9ACTN
MTTTAARSTGRSTGSAGALRALQVGALLGVLSVVWQFVTAGHYLTDGSWLGAHSGGAVVLHVLTGLAALAAIWWRVSGGRTWVAVLAVATFALTFLQAWSGDHAPLSVHVPLSLTVVGGTVWLLVASLGRRPASGTA